MAGSIGDLIVRIGADPGNFKQVMSELGEGLNEFSEKIKSGAESILAFGEALAVTEGLKKLGEDALEAYDSVQKLTNSITALTGSAAQAGEVLEGIEEITKTQPFSFPELASSAQKLVAFGVSAGNIVKVLQDSTNAARATGNSFDAVASSLGRVELSGQVSARQLVQLGISWQDIAKTMNTTVEHVQNLFKKGGQDAAKDLDDLLRTVEQKFGDFEKVPLSIGEQWKVFGNQIHAIFAEIGEAIEPTVRRVLAVFQENLLPAIQGLIASFNSLSAPVKEFIVTVGLAVVAIAPLAVAVGGFALALAGLEAVIPPITAALAALGVTVGGGGGLAVAFTAVATAAGIAAAAFAGWKVSQLIGDFMSMANEALNVTGNLKTMGTLLDALPGSKTIKIILEVLGDSVGGLVDKIVDQAKRNAFGPAAETSQALRNAGFISDPLIASNLPTAPTPDYAKQQIAKIDKDQSAADTKTALTQAEIAKAAAAAAKELANEKRAYQELLKAQKDVTDEEAKFNKLLEATGLQQPHLEKYTQEINDLSVALNRGKLTEDQWAQGMSNLEAKINKPLTDMSDKFRGLANIKMEQMFFPPEFFAAAQRSIKAIQEVQDAFEKFDEVTSAKKGIKAIQDQFADITAMGKAFKDLGKQSSEALSDALKQSTADFNAMVDAQKRGLATSTDVQVEWNKMAKDAIALADSARNAAEEGLQLNIQWKELTGQDATKQVMQLNAIQLATESAKLAAHGLSDVLLGIEKASLDVFDNLAKSFTKLIVDGGNVKAALKDVVKSFETEVVGSIVKGFTDQLKKAFIDDVLQPIIKNLFGSAISSLITGATQAPQIAATSANTVALGANTAAIGALTAAMGGQAAAGAAGAAGSVASAAKSAAGAASSLAGVVTAVAGVVTAISSVFSNFQLQRQISTLGLIEVNTREEKIHVFNMLGVVNTYLPVLNDLVDIWGSILEGNQILRDIAAATGQTASVLSSFGDFVGHLEQVITDAIANLGGAGGEAFSLSDLLDEIKADFGALKTSVDAGSGALESLITDQIATVVSALSDQTSALVEAITGIKAPDLSGLDPAIQQAIKSLGAQSSTALKAVMDAASANAAAGQKAFEQGLITQTDLDLLIKKFQDAKAAYDKAIEDASAAAQSANDAAAAAASVATGGDSGTPSPQSLAQQLVSGTFNSSVPFSTPTQTNPDWTGLARGIYELGQLIVGQFDRLIDVLKAGVAITADGTKAATAATKDLAQEVAAASVDASVFYGSLGSAVTAIAPAIEQVATATNAVAQSFSQQQSLMEEFDQAQKNFFTNGTPVDRQSFINRGLNPENMSPSMLMGTPLTTAERLALEQSMQVFQAPAGSPGFAKIDSPSNPFIAHLTDAQLAPLIAQITQGYGAVGSMSSYDRTIQPSPVPSDSASSGSTANVYVTAVDPTSRSVTRGIIQGMEEAGIRIR